MRSICVSTRVSHSLRNVNVHRNKAKFYFCKNHSTSSLRLIRAVWDFKVKCGIWDFKICLDDLLKQRAGLRVGVRCASVRYRACASVPRLVAARPVSRRRQLTRVVSYPKSLSALCYASRSTPASIQASAALTLESSEVITSSLGFGPQRFHLAPRWQRTSTNSLQRWPLTFRNCAGARRNSGGPSACGVTVKTWILLTYADVQWRMSRLKNPTSTKFWAASESGSSKLSPNCI